MFVVTNRELHENKRGLAQFGKRPNPKGPNELRMAEVTKVRGKWKVVLIPDLLPKPWLTKAGINAKWLRDMGYDPRQPNYGSQYVGAELLKRVNPGRVGSRRKGKDLLVFVHGYNNDLEDVVERAAGFERKYGVECLAFSWPANGGGVSGVASYLSDKHDARVSVGALDRTLAKLDDLLGRFNVAYIKEIHAAAMKKHPDNSETRRALIARQADRGCPFTVNLVCHSMGNYLFKHLLLSSASLGTRLMFDNVALVAADTNNKDHARWVDRIRARRRVFVCINESDSALRVSRMKLGDQQLARLGHYPRELNSEQGVYVDFSRARKVGSSHAYFEGAPTTNASVRRFFRRAFTGEHAEIGLRFDVDRNMYRIS